MLSCSHNFRRRLTPSAVGDLTWHAAIVYVRHWSIGLPDDGTAADAISGIPPYTGAIIGYRRRGRLLPCSCRSSGSLHMSATVPIGSLARSTLAVVVVFTGCWQPYDKLHVCRTFTPADTCPPLRPNHNRISIPDPNPKFLPSLNFNNLKC